MVFGEKLYIVAPFQHAAFCQGTVNFCSFSPTDVKAITAGRDGTVKVWEFEEGIESVEPELRTESGWHQFENGTCGTCLGPNWGGGKL